MSRRIGMTIGVVAAVLLLAVLAGLVGVLYARPATAQTVGVPGMRQVTVVGHGEVKGKPDTATVQIGVETEAAVAKDALAKNTEEATALQAKLKELGVAETDIQTSNFSIYPIYSTDGRQITGYHVSNSVTVKIRALDKAGTLLDQVVQAGANSVSSISFSVDDPAKAGGAAVGDVLVITENLGAQPPVPVMMAAPAAEAADSKAVPVQPGEQSFAIDVQVTYQLR